MKYLLIFLVVSASAFADLQQDMTVRAIHEKWTFDFQVPAHPYALGLVDKPEVRKHAKYAGLKAATNLPAHFDLTSQLTPVKDQGSCGGCWAFGTIGVIENFPFAPKPASQVILSEQDVLDCDTVSQGCNGGYFDGFDFAKNTGVATEQSYPFLGFDQTCNAKAQAAAKVLDWAFVSGSDTVEPTIDQIKTALYTYGAPVAVGIYASGDLQAYTGGVFNACTTGALNHMVDIVGWDDTDGDWIVRNSWGTSFGENGYFRIAREDSTGKKCLSIGSVTAFVSNASLVNN
jgi:C1A family cysteine protease